MAAAAAAAGGVDVRRLAECALAGVVRVAPNCELDGRPGGCADEAALRARHPAFHGCFDWHSAVHTHWLLARLLSGGGGAGRLGPSDAARARMRLEMNLTEPNMTAEAAALAAHSPEWEMPYGMSWLLRLALELELAAGSTVGEERAQWVRWREALRPLEELVGHLAPAATPGTCCSQPLRAAGGRAVRAVVSAAGNPTAERGAYQLCLRTRARARLLARRRYQ